MEELITAISTLDLRYVYIAVFFIAFVENLFPPLPSDVIVVFGGSLVAIGSGNAFLTVALASCGSAAGFFVMYLIGRSVGDRVLETGRIKFISLDLVHSVENWFRRYGYWVIVLNRFLAGTRAVVAFGAGMSDLRMTPTLLLSFVSSAVWNTILVLAGIYLGSNWRQIGDWLAAYSLAVSILIASALVVWGIAAWLKNRRRSAARADK